MFKNCLLIIVIACFSLLNQVEKTLAQSPLTSAIVNTVGSTRAPTETLNSTWGGTSGDHGGVLTVWTTHKGTTSYYEAYFNNTKLNPAQVVNIFAPGSNRLIGRKIRWVYSGSSNYSGTFLFKVGSGITNLQARIHVR